MREGLFSSISPEAGTLSGVRFLDLYAGSGSVGIEAWSRGAEHVLAVEQDQRAARVIRRNADAVGADGAVVVRACAVDRLASTKPVGRPYEIVFADPPYDVAGDHLAEVLTALQSHGWFLPAAVLVVERATRTGFRWPDWAEPEKSRSYGESTLWYARAPGPGGLTGSPPTRQPDRPDRETER
jgi:16S rRNA (guanine966-N2)-methyltransferase